MPNNRVSRWAVVLSLLAVFATIARAEEPSLSAAETAIFNRQVATLKSAGERKMAQDWSNAKKVGEFICRPAALSILKKQVKGVDKVFLGADTADSLSLLNNGQLTGSGQYRDPQGWQYFTFTCDVNPATGKVTDFRTVPLKEPPPAH